MKTTERFTDDHGGTWEIEWELCDGGLGVRLRLPTGEVRRLTHREGATKQATHVEGQVDLWGEEA